MRQPDYTASRSNKRKSELLGLALVSTVADLQISKHVAGVAVLEAIYEDKNAERVLLRSILISSTTFNLNALSDHECVTKIRFLKGHIGLIADLAGWAGGKTKKNRYF